jgi:hypothetical protein
VSKNVGKDRDVMEEVGSVLVMGKAPSGPKKGVQSQKKRFNGIYILPRSVQSQRF